MLWVILKTDLSLFVPILAIFIIFFYNLGPEGV